MTSSKLYFEISQTLAEADLIPAEVPMRLGTAIFRFVGAWRSKGTGLELVVFDDLSEDLAATVRQVEALAHMLDRLESRRSLTVLVLGADLDDTNVGRLSRVARLILLDPDACTGKGSLSYLHGALAPLLPFRPFHRSSLDRDPLRELGEQLGRARAGRLARLITASRFGRDEVAQAMAEFVKTGA